jgi:predicted ATPase
MITSVHFQNFKALRDATLPLGAFTLIVGPNGSGKSTAMQGLKFASNPEAFSFEEIVTAGWQRDAEPIVEVEVEWLEQGLKTTTVSGKELKRTFGPTQKNAGSFTDRMREKLERFQVFSFDASALAAPVRTGRNAELRENGHNLAGVLASLNGREPERFEALNKELQRWLPEFDRVVFDFPDAGETEFLLRTRKGHHKYRACDLSHGTLFALAYLTLAYIADPPSIVCFEEPDRGIHPRLLNEIREGMYRLAYPKEFGESREPVQVIATTHSPYLLDLYKDHPEEIVIAHKEQKGVHFERLSDKPHISELLESAPLGDIWFSGVLGGVPSSP